MRAGDGESLMQGQAVKKRRDIYTVVWLHKKKGIVRYERKEGICEKKVV